MSKSKHSADHSADIPADGTDSRLAALKREVLLRKLQQASSGTGTGAAAASEAIPLADRSQPLPLSPMQRRLWFITQLEADAGGQGSEAQAAYHLSAVFRLQGALDPSALRTAFVALLLRHEILRSRIVLAGDEPVLQIADAGDIAELLSKLLLQRRSAEPLTEIQRAIARPFDLSQGPLLRVLWLSSTVDGEQQLCVVMHHLIADGWSLAVLLREFAALYAAATQQAQAVLPAELLERLPALPLQYADYAAWQQRQLHESFFQQQRAYWQQTLAGAPPLLALPTDRPRPARQDHAGAACAFRLTPQQSRELRALARQHGLSLFMLLYAGWAILLARLSGQADIVIGTPVANRPRRELEGLIGCFVNTLALRVHIDPAQSVGDLLAEVKRLCLAAFAHQTLPFEQVVEAVKPLRSSSHSPLFQVMLSLQNAPQENLAGWSLPDVRLELLDTPEYSAHSAHSAQFDLALMLHEEADDHEHGCGCIAGELLYATALFDQPGIQRWLDSYQHLLSAICVNVTQPVACLPLLDAAQKAQLLESFNATQRAYPQQEMTLPELFAAQVARTPQALALAYEDQRLTYAELDQRSNQLAHWLRDRGVGPDRLVAVCLERSMELVLALLAVLKAGGAYVPLETSLPPRRMADMLADAQPVVVLTHSRLREKLAQLDPAAQFSLSCVDELPALNAQAQAQAISALSAADTGLQPRHLAYVIYTSGSTGQPKGVMNEQRALVNRLLWMQEAYQLTPADRVLQKTPYAFDVSVWEFFWPLITGAGLVLARPEGHREPLYLRRLIAQAGITRLHFVPSMLQVFLDALGEHAADCRSLRQIVLSGEALSAHLQNQCLQQLPWVRLSNLYGPTEAAIDVTHWECRLDPTLAAVPIGKPIANLRMYVLDEHLQPVPIGVTGEIYIGGAGVARGYLQRPELTAQRFIADPFMADSAARMYRTGDLGRWRADGVLEYLGRNDHQVKLRGQRIELGEIESQLLLQPGIREAVVLLREDRPGDQRLVAYLTMEAAQALEAAPLRARLQTRLPDYMLPAHFVPLARMPLTANGKLDRQTLHRLPAPGRPLAAVQTGVGSVSSDDEPQGELEQRLARIWQELLQVERVGRHDNYFELGGHSLLIIKLLQRLRQAGLHAEVRTLFDAPTVAELARQVSRLPASRQDISGNRNQPLHGLSPAEIEHIAAQMPGGKDNIQDIYPLAPLQQGLLFHHQMAVSQPGAEDEAGRDVYVLSFLLHIASPRQAENFIAALRQVLARHDILRTAIVWQGLSQPVQVVLREVELPLVHCAAAEELSKEPLSLSLPPLLRLQIADAREGGKTLRLSFHHIISDHYGLEIILAEIQALLAGEQLPPARPYRDFVAATLRQDPAAAQAYFSSRLADIDSSVAPFGWLDVYGGYDVYGGHDHARPIDEHTQWLSPALSRALRARAQEEKVSVAALVHLAMGLLLQTVCATDNVVFGSVLSGRLQHQAGEASALDALETLGIPGLFINTLPLRLSLGPPAASIGSLLQQTQQALAALLPFEQTPLALALRCSGLAAAGSKLPLFTAVLNYRHSQQPPLQLDGVSVLASAERSNYPLMLNVDDLGGDGGFKLTLQTAGAAPPTSADVAQSFLKLLEVLADPDDTQLNAPAMLALQSELAAWHAHRAEPPVEVVGTPRRGGRSPQGGTTRRGGRAAPPAEAQGGPPADLEKVLIDLWQELLQVSRVRRDDDFFLLGGHSLIAMQLAARLAQQLGWPVSVRQIFDTPTLAGLAAALAGQAAVQGESTQPLIPRLRHLPDCLPDHLPLSYAQRRLWFLSQIGAAATAYHIPAALHLQGALDAARLETAFTHLLARHAVLSATLIPVGGEPMQWPQASQPIRLPVIEASGHTPASLSEQLREFVLQPFDLETGPLLRARLYRLGADEHVLAVIVHHIVADGWSLQLALQELLQLYRQPAPALPDLTIGFFDYAVWQRQWIEAGGLQASRDYWLQRLSGELPMLQLPTDRPRPTVQSFQGGRYSQSLPPALVRRIQRACQQHQLTPYMLLLAIYQVLLYRLSGQTDILIGTPLAGRDHRHHPQLQQLIGCFVNMLVMRCDLRDDAGIGQHFQQVRSDVLAAYAHQDYPFDLLVDQLHSRRDLARQAVFDTSFTLDAASRQPLPQVDGLRITPLALPLPRAKFDLSVSVAWPAEVGVEAEAEAEEECAALLFEYSTDLFEAGTIARFAGYYLNLLTDALAHPERRLSELRLIDDGERAMLLGAQFAGLPKQYAIDDHLAARFSRLAEQQPQAVALRWQGRQLSYGELEARANQLAHELIARGVQPGQAVALCLERSFGMIIALLAVLKTGACYVPIEPTLPAARQRFMLEDSSACLLLSHAVHESSGCAVPILQVDRDTAQAVTATISTPPAVNISPTDRAYIIYTSGSTGQPKGCELTHANVLRLFAACGEAAIPFGPAQVWSLFHSYAFDFSVWEIFGALLHGGRLVIVPQEAARSPLDFAALLAAEKVTLLSQTPSAFQRLLELAQAQAEAESATDSDASAHAWAQSLRHVVFGGEALEYASLRPWFRHALNPQTHLINMYGITETTVHVSWREISRAEVERQEVFSGASNVGRPLADLSVYILDQHLQPQPVGVAGELYVGGGGLARGYLNRPELTAQRFITHPCQPGARLYRSGDLACWNAQGDIIHLGRIDQQVKIHGYRIELGEIEAQLLQHPAISACAVLAVQDRRTLSDRLIAWFVAREALTASQLRSHLATQLPAYMLPHSFQPLSELPLTRNGKLDRERLLQSLQSLQQAEDGQGQTLRLARPRLDAPYVMPETALEIALARIWSAVLGVQRIGLADNFFELGGDSFGAYRLMMRISSELGRDLPLESIFRQQTIAAMAQALTQAAEEGAAESSLVQIQAGAPGEPGSAPRTPFFCAHQAGGDVLSFRALSEALGPHQPFYGVQSAGRLLGEARHHTLEEMCADYLRDIRRIQPQGPYFIGGHSMGGKVAYELTRQLEAAGEQVAVLAIIDSDIVNRNTSMLDSMLLLSETFRLGIQREALVELEPNQMLEYLLTAGKKRFARVLEIAYDMDILPRGFRTRDAEMFLNRIATNIHVSDAYVAPPIRTPVTLFLASEHTENSYRIDIAAWRQVALGGLEVVEVPGNHLNLIQRPHVQVLGGILRGLIAK
jgi:amino acid adenylation domain-containing protein